MERCGTLNRFVQEKRGCWIEVRRFRGKTKKRAGEPDRFLRKGIANDYTKPAFFRVA